MNPTDKRIAKKITRDFLNQGCVSCGVGALEIAAGLHAAEDVKAVVAEITAGLRHKGVVVRGPGLQAS